jgi:hypothetical protein
MPDLSPLGARKRTLSASKFIGSRPSKYKFPVWFLDLKFQRVIRPSGPRLAAPKPALADLGNLSMPTSGKPEIGYHAPVIEPERGPQTSLRDLRIA